MPLWHLLYPLEWLPPHFCQSNLNSTELSKPWSDICLEDVRLTNPISLWPVSSSFPQYTIYSMSLALTCHVREAREVTSASLGYSAKDCIIIKFIGLLWVNLEALLLKTKGNNIHTWGILATTCFQNVMNWWSLVLSFIFQWKCVLPCSG